VPETIHSTDVLQSVRVFRQNMGLVPRNPAAGRAFFQWQLRLGGWFISYENGKSAVSVKNARKCLSVCMWEVSPQLETGTTKQPDGSTCTWFTNNDHLWQAAVNRRKEGRLSNDEEVPRLDRCRNAMLLHFCVCDFASFWRKRWTQLGYLSASDQFRVRTTSGAMMARFYRLQCEHRQWEAKELFEAMCVVQDSKAVADDVEVGILLRADPRSPAGPGGSSWPASPHQVPYLELAKRSEAQGKHFDAWLLYGKATEGSVTSAELFRCRATCALAANLAACAVADACRGVELGDALCHEIAASGFESLHRLEDALRAAVKGARLLHGSPSGTLLQEMATRLQNSPAAAAAQTQGGIPLPSPEELQHFVMQAIRPDGKESRLYGALLAVAMGWWHEVCGDAQKFKNALGRAAITARRELAAVDAAVRPMPVRRIRELWDAKEMDLKASGAVAIDLDPVPGLWAELSRACKEHLKERTELSVTGCDKDEQKPFGVVFALCSALAAEVLRAFRLMELEVVTELRISRAQSSGAEVDNGGLLPDNRREVSFRLFVPVDESGLDSTAASLTLQAKDREVAMSYPVKAGRVFIWWSRQTFHQILGGDGCFAICCWAVIAQKSDAKFSQRR